jgi:VCBS repeat-containing protein
VAADDSYSTDEDTPLTVIAPGVLGDDSDVDGDTLTAVLVSGPAHGTVALNANGSFSYTPARNYSGPDSFTYKASDGSLQSGARTVDLTVNAVNDAPTAGVALGGSCSPAGTSGTMNLNVGDQESSVGVLTLVASSSNTTVVPNASITFGGSGANRTVTIVPVVKNSGTAVITITASDPGGASTTTTIFVRVGTDKKETLTGTNGADLIVGLNGEDTINALDGNDLVCSGNAAGTLSGGAGHDTLDGGNGDDVVRGGPGNDILRGGSGNDRLQGEDGDDTLTGGMGADAFSGGTGTDTVTDFNAVQGDTKDPTIP